MTQRRIAGRYLLLDVLGQGGMGTVWRALDETLGREVAVKEVTSSGADGAGGRERALREARTAARLNHPCAVTVHDVVDDGEALQIVMELIRAPTLTALVSAGGPLPPAQVAAIGRQLAGVLGEAHRAGVVHRDVKPANVMVLDDGRVKLTDFGMAQLRGDPRLTAAGAVLGSPGFMAPEQLTAGDVGAPADLWALGATLYFAVDRLPFTRDTVPAMAAAMLSLPPDPVRLAGPLAPVLLALLDADPERRPYGEVLDRMLRDVAAGAAALPATVVSPGAAVPPVPVPPGVSPGVSTGAAPVATLPPVPTDAAAQRMPGRVTTTAAAASGAWDDVPRRRPLLLGTVGTAVVVLVAVLVVVTLSLVRPAGDGSKGGSASGGRKGGGAATTGAGRGATAAPAAGTAASGTVTSPAGQPAAGRRTLAQATLAPAGQALPTFWSSATNSAGGYRVGVPQTWDVFADGTTTEVSWPGDTTFDVAFEVHQDAAGTDPYRRLQQDAAAFATANAGNRYQRITLTPNSTYRGKPAAAWEFTWVRDDHVEHGLEVAFRAGAHTYTVLFREKDLWWKGGGTAQFQPGFETAFTPLDEAG